jgi:hypothetical protein
MSTPHEKLANAYQDEKKVTVTDTDGTVYEECLVADFTRVETATFEVWRFVLRNLYGGTRLFGPDLESVEIVGDVSDEKD